MGTVGIQMTTQPILVAPAPIWLEATNPTGFQDEVGNAITEPVTDGDYDPTYHKITYNWIVERETSPGVWEQMTGSYPRVVNIVTAWNMAYVAYGKRVSFRLPEPGTYRFRCWAVDMQGNTGIATTATVTVQDPDVAFSAANTIIYAGDGDFAGAPAGDTQVSSMAALNTAIQARSNPTRIRFKPSETVSGSLEIVAGARAEYIDTWTPGSMVTRRASMQSRGLEFMYAIHMANSQVQTTWVDHVFEADWDETTETGDSGTGHVFETRYVTEALRNLCYNCDFSGLKVAWLSLDNGATAPDTVDRRWMIADCVVTNWKNYGFYCDRNPGGQYDFLGSTMARQHNALAGPFPLAKEELRNDHGPLRIANCRHYYISCCDFFNLAGWSGGAPNDLPAANATVRLAASSLGEIQSGIVDRCVAEGGYITWKMDGQDEEYGPEYPGNYLFDKVLTLVSARTHHPWSTAMGGTTRRNCYTWAPNIPYYDRNTRIDWEVRYFQDGINTPVNNTDYPMLNYCNTFMGLADDTVVPLTSGDETAWGANYVRENYVNHQPNARAPVTTFAPINTNPAAEAVPGVTPRTSGVRWNYQLIVLTSVSVAPGGTLTIPYSNIDSDNGAGDGDTTPTNQAYWQALPASDNQHAVKVKSDEEPYYAVRGHFSVSYADPTNIVITNNSGNTWSGTVGVHLDRKSRLATDIPALTQYASPSSVPMPTPQTGSSAVGQADIGYVAYDDFLGRVRSMPKTAGAIEV